MAKDVNAETPAPKPKKENIFVRLLALLVTAALCLGALFLVANWDRYNLDALKRWFATRSISTGDSGQGEPFTHGGGEKISFAYLNDGLLMTSSAGVRYYAFSGEQYAEQVEMMEHPVLTATGSAGVAYDGGGQTVRVYQKGREDFSLSLEGDGDLLSARVNDSGWLAVTAQESGYKGAVTVYNAEHQRVFRLNRSSTFVVDAAVSPDCKSAAIVTMGQQGGRFESQLLVYHLDSEEPIAQVSLGGMTVLDLDYETGQVWVLGESALTIVSTSDWTRQTYSFGRNYLKGCSLGGDGFALVLLGRYRAGSAAQAVTIGPDGQAAAQLELRGQVLSYDAAGRYLCLLEGGALNLYTRDLELYRSLEDAGGARYTALSANGSVALADRQKVWLYIPG